MQGVGGSNPLVFTTKALVARVLFSYGGVAQLGERLNGIQEVMGSIPTISTRIKKKNKKPFSKEKRLLVLYLNFYNKCSPFHVNRVKIPFSLGLFDRHGIYDAVDLQIIFHFIDIVFFKCHHIICNFNNLFGNTVLLRLFHTFFEINHSHSRAIDHHFCDF